MILDDICLYLWLTSLAAMIIFGYIHVVAVASFILFRNPPLRVCVTHLCVCIKAFPWGSVVKNPPAVQEIEETWVWSRGREDPWQPTPAFLWEYVLTQEPDGLQSTESRRVGHDRRDWDARACMCILHLLCPSFVIGCFGCFPVLVIVSSVAVNIRMRISFWIILFSRYMPRSGIAGSYGSFTFCV